MPLNKDILNTLINNQKYAIKYHSVFAITVILLGCCLVIISNFFISTPNPNDSVRLILSIGGGFISTVSAYPINQIITRREKIATYKILRLKLETMNDSELKKAEELIWKSIEKII